MKKSFFKTREYQNWLKCKEAVEAKPTSRNWEVTMEWAVKAMELCAKEFNDVGWDNSKVTYAWMPRYNCKGG